MADLNAKKIGSNVGRKSKTFLPGRTCSLKNCDKLLSIYNKKKFCFQHAPLTYPRVRGHLPRGDK